MMNLGYFLLREHKLWYTSTSSLSQNLPFIAVLFNNEPRRSQKGLKLYCGERKGKELLPQESFYNPVKMLPCENKG